MKTQRISKLMHDHEHLVVKFRQDLHRIPELGGNEKKTSEYICNILAAEEIPFIKRVAGYGIVAKIKTGQKGPNLMFRADMDALPILEKTTDLLFASQHSGMMHSCGHDGHMAMVLTTAIILNKVRSEIQADSIRFVFQPAEEGPGGALAMIRSGIMKSPQVDYVFGCHIWPELDEGCVGIKAGPLMAGESNFKIKVVGSGGHAAIPHLCVDPIDTGCQIVGALQRIVSRHTNPLSPTVLTVTQFKAGNTNNIIPKTANIEGSFRTFDSDISKSLPSRIVNIVGGVCKAMGARHSTETTSGYPITVNDQEATEIVHKAAKQVFGVSGIVKVEKTMGSEDISYFMKEAKGCYFFLGSGKNGKNVHLHTSTFNFDEKILVQGVETFCRVALLSKVQLQPPDR